MSTIPNPFTNADLEERLKRKRREAEAAAALRLGRARDAGGAPLMTVPEVLAGAKAVSDGGGAASESRRSLAAGMDHRREGLARAPIGSTVQMTPGSTVGPTQLRKMGITPDYSNYSPPRHPGAAAPGTASPVTRTGEMSPGGRRLPLTPAGRRGTTGTPLTAEDRKRIGIPDIPFDSISPIQMTRPRSADNPVPGSPLAKLRATDGQGRTFQQKVDAADPADQQQMVEDRTARHQARQALSAERRQTSQDAYANIQAAHAERRAAHTPQTPLTRDQMVRQYRERLRLEAGRRQQGAGAGAVDDYDQQLKQVKLEQERARLEQMRNPTPKTPQVDPQIQARQFRFDALQAGMKSLNDELALHVEAKGGLDSLDPEVAEDIARRRQLIHDEFNALTKLPTSGNAQGPMTGPQTAPDPPPLQRLTDPTSGVRYMGRPPISQTPAPPAYPGMTPGSPAAMQTQQQDAAVGAIPGQAQPPTGGPMRIGSDAEYDALPSGAMFMDPSGNLRRKP